MSNETHKPLTPAEIKKLAKKIVTESPIYIHEEPTTVGSPENLTDDEEDHEQPATQKPERSKK